MYVRFFRWACDRIEDDGIIALVTNRSFIDARNFDGFRKVAPREFAEALIVDLGGDYKKKGVGGGGNVFGIGTGVAISLWVKRRHVGDRPCRIRYIPSPTGSGEDKLEWLGSSRAATLHWNDLVPKQGYWIDNPETEFGDAIPVASKGAKFNVRGANHAIFWLFSLGISANRDEWLYELDASALEQKVRHFIDAYDAVPANAEDFPDTIKWSRNLKRRLARNQREPFSAERITSYRPYNHRWLYQSEVFTDELGLTDELFPLFEANRTICFTDPTAQKPWLACAVDSVPDLHYVGAGAGAVCTPRFRYSKGGDRLDNITDWALAQFVAHYGDKAAITKDDIFAYVYAVLHDPIYRETYALNLKREFPRIPFYSDFRRWRDWGQTLLDLHIGYESVGLFSLIRTDVPDKSLAQLARRLA